MDDLLIFFFGLLSLSLHFFFEDRTDIAFSILGGSKSFLDSSDPMFHPLIDAFKVGDLMLDELCATAPFLLL